MRVRKRLSVPLLLCAALLVYAMFSPSPRLVPEPQPAPGDQQVPDSYAHDVSIRQFGDDGELQDETEAQLLRRYADKALIELDRPRRRSYAGDNAWIATALRGTLFERNDRLDLEDSVEIRYPGENVQFRSETLIISLDKRTARSPSEVRVFQDDSETRADSLYLDLNRQVATINGNVRSVYVPER